VGEESPGQDLSRSPRSGAARPQHSVRANQQVPESALPFTPDTEARSSAAWGEQMSSPEAGEDPTPGSDVPAPGSSRSSTNSSPVLDQRQIVT
jgi:hypothetical protein